MKIDCPLPWGEGVPQPALSPAGAGRVRGCFSSATRRIQSGTSHHARHQFLRVMNFHSLHRFSVCIDDL